MQFRFPIAFFVFLGSYLPLSLILLAQDYDYEQSTAPFCWDVASATCSLPFHNSSFSIGIFVACLICFLLTVIALQALRPKRSVVIAEARHAPADLMNYTLPYVVSFMSIDYQSTGKFVGFVIFLVWMFWITYKSGRLVLNPVLIILGWKYYDVSYTFPTDATLRSGAALARSPIDIGKPTRFSEVQDVLILEPTTKQRE